MKKIMMTLAAVCVAATMNAQVYVGGSLGFETTSHDGNTNSQLTLMPEIGYALDDNLAVGIAFGYGQTKESVEVNNVEVSQTNKKFVINPYLR